LLIALSCIWRAKGGLDAETQELVDGDSRAGGARGALCNAGVTRELLYREAGEERAPPSQAAAWSWSAAGIKEQEGMRSNGKADEPWTQLATRIPRELHRRLRICCVTHEPSSGTSRRRRLRGSSNRSEDGRREQPETRSAFLAEPMTAIPFAAALDAR